MQYSNKMTKNIPKSVMNKFDLTGKNIVVSGGAGFLGEHFVDAILEANGNPIILDNDKERLIELEKKYKNTSTMFFLVDILNYNQLVKISRKIISKKSKIDVLINATAFAMKNLLKGGKEFFNPIENYSRDLWEIAINVNLTGTFLVTQMFGKSMIENKSGVIINIASDVGIISPDPRIYEPNELYDYKGVSFNTPISYSVSKAGIISFTRHLATHWAKYGIRVNALSPAGVYNNHEDKFVEQLTSRIPLARMADPEELKGPIIFLASDASSFMTGTNLVVDGGRTIW